MTKLKTFLMPSGFYELAVAAPSRKAALAAWGMTHDAFARGEAMETTNAQIVAAATSQPGMVLKRPIGTKGAFLEKPVAPKAPEPPKGFKKSILSKKQNADLKKAQAALARAERAHQTQLEKIAGTRARLDAQEEAEAARWDTLREKLRGAVAKAKSS